MTMTREIENIPLEDPGFQPVTLTMTDQEFSLFSRMIYSRLGIKMPYSKKLMLISRLMKRLKYLGMKTFREYYDYVCSEKGMNEEFNSMIDAVTTNKTDFFREPDHFNILVKNVLPELVGSEIFNERKIIHLWSAGCSTGEEAYTLAMVLSDYFSDSVSKFSILATDVSMRVLQCGCDAVYAESIIQPIPLTMRKKYLMRGTGEKNGLFRIVPDLRKKVCFRQMNLMSSDFNIGMQMDIIFCRNVIIYFDKETQVRLFRKIYNNLVPGGYLFIGSSETLYGVNNDFIPAGPTVYRKSVK